MRKRGLRSRAGLLLTVSSVLLGASLAPLASATNPPTGWLSATNPVLRKAVDLPSNQLPTISNRDCTQMGFITSLGATGTDCFVNSAIGQMALYGSPVLFGNTSQAVGVTGYSGMLLQPIPNQSLTVATSSAPIIGSYLHFYSDLRSVLVPHYNGVGGPLSYYTVSQPPNLHLKDKNGNLVVVSSFSTPAYSSDGAWMLIDAPSRGFLRINMATLEVIPFAPSLNSSGDYGYHVAMTAISDDGRYAAIASTEYRYFKVYDLSTCTGQSTNNYSTLLNCQFRDYWPYVSASVPGFRSLYSIRFANDDNISLTATYNWSGANFSAAKFALTAPGKAVSGLNYLALGDSYISGEGAFSYREGTDNSNNKCHLSTNAYPYLVGKWFDSYASVACSGARAKDITGFGVQNYNADNNGAQATDKRTAAFDEEIYSNFLPGYREQLNFIRLYQPSAITLSIGGNDLGFAKILELCVPPSPGMDTCFANYQDRAMLVKAMNGLFPALVSTYRQILDADYSGAKLYVVGYPQIAVADGNCAANVHLNHDEIIFSQQLISYLDSVIERAAKAAGAAYVDTQDALAGHRLCEARSWDVAVNGFTVGDDSGLAGFKFIGQESYHPNVLGHQLLAKAVLEATNNFMLPMPAADPTLQAPVFDTSTPLLQSTQNIGSTYAYDIAAQQNLTQEVLFKNGTAQINVAGLQPNSQYQLVVHSDPVTLGTFTADASGNLAASVSLPANTPAGFHVLHLYGPNMAGQKTDLYEFIYVAASADALVPHATNQCLIVSLSGEDVDQDGIDDACDPVIGEAPVVSQPSQPVATTSPSQQSNNASIQAAQPTNTQQSLSSVATIGNTLAPQNLPEVLGLAAHNALPTKNLANSSAGAAKPQPNNKAGRAIAGAFVIVLCVAAIGGAYRFAKRQA